MAVAAAPAMRPRAHQWRIRRALWTGTGAGSDAVGRSARSHRDFCANLWLFPGSGGQLRYRRFPHRRFFVCVAHCEYGVAVDIGTDDLLSVAALDEFGIERPHLAQVAARRRPVVRLQRIILPGGEIFEKADDTGEASVAGMDGQVNCAATSGLFEVIIKLGAADAEDAAVFLFCRIMLLFSALSWKDQAVLFQINLH